MVELICLQCDCCTWALWDVDAEKVHCAALQYISFKQLSNQGYNQITNNHSKLKTDKQPHTYSTLFCLWGSHSEWGIIAICELYCIISIISVCVCTCTGGEQGVQDAGASGASAGGLLWPGALLPGCVTGSTQDHRQTAVCTGQHLHRARSEGTDTTNVIQSHSSSTGVKLLNWTTKHRLNDGCGLVLRVSACLSSWWPVEMEKVPRSFTTTRAVV